MNILTKFILGLIVIATAIIVKHADPVIGSWAFVAGFVLLYLIGKA